MIRLHQTLWWEGLFHIFDFYTNIVFDNTFSGGSSPSSSVNRNDSSLTTLQQEGLRHHLCPLQ
jgi:hypothetical protein